MNKNGITLLELLISIVLLSLIVIFTGGVFLSGKKFYSETKAVAEAQRNALLPLMHIQKYAGQSASKFNVSGSSTVNFNIYNNQNLPGEFAGGPTIPCSYTYNNVKREIVFSKFATPVYTWHHIDSCTFSTSHNGAILNVTLTASDKDNIVSYSVETSVSARYINVQ